MIRDHFYVADLKSVATRIAIGRASGAVTWCRAGSCAARRLLAGDCNFVSDVRLQLVCTATESKHHPSLILGQGEVII
jgi:hypothetical protein